MTNEEFQQKMLTAISSMENHLSTLTERISSIDERLSVVEKDVGQTKENTDYIKAILHRVEELDAKYDGLLTSTATSTALADIAQKTDTRLVRMEKKIDILNHKVTAQAGEIELLKAE